MTVILSPARALPSTPKTQGGSAAVPLGIALVAVLGGVGGFEVWRRRQRATVPDVIK